MAKVQICTLYICLVTSENKIFEVFSMYIQCGVNIEPRVMISAILVEFYMTMLRAKYLSSMPFGYREEWDGHWVLHTVSWWW